VVETVDRYRDLAIGPDAATIYVATDPSGLARDAERGATDQPANRGAILEFTYTGTKRTAAGQ
jgi:hypothetical protein